MELLVENAIYTALAANANITGIVSSANIFAEIAPASAGDTFIILTLNAGSTLNDTPRDATDLRYAVMAISTNANTANTLAGYIRDTFNEVSLTIGSGWTAYRTQVLTPIRFVEQTDRVQYWHRGHIIRIRSAK